MLEDPFQNIRSDFHVSMSMGREAGGGSNPVIVNYSQGAKARVVRVIVLPQGKGVIGIQPTEPDVPPLFPPYAKSAVHPLQSPAFETMLIVEA